MSKTHVFFLLLFHVSVRVRACPCVWYGGDETASPCHPPDTSHPTRTPHTTLG
eukprot:m.485275 g.485275  ORF g.485275 m.485275 type:complete len:53 (-) comp23743_c0_seq1:165-323(-)